MKKTGFVILSLFIVQLSLGQMLHKRDVFPGVKKIKVISYQGAKPSGWWREEFYNDKGQLVREVFYKRHKKLKIDEYVYNEQGDEIFTISINVKKSASRDTLSKRIYS